MEAKRSVLRIDAAAPVRLAISDPVRVSTKRVWHAARIRDVSPEGIGVELGTTGQLMPGSPVTVELKIGVVDAVLKGQLMWSDDADDNRCRAGVRLRLEVLDQRTREAFFNWIARSATEQGKVEALRDSVGRKN